MYSQAMLLWRSCLIIMSNVLQAGQHTDAGCFSMATDGKTTEEAPHGQTLIARQGSYRSADKVVQTKKVMNGGVLKDSQHQSLLGR